MDATNSNNNSHLVSIPPGLLPSDVIVTSPIIHGEDGDGGAAMAGFGMGGGAGAGERAERRNEVHEISRSNTQLRPSLVDH